MVADAAVLLDGKGWLPAMLRVPGATYSVDSGDAQAVGADIRHGGARACYVPSLDQIRMPSFEAFRDSVAYYV